MEGLLGKGRRASPTWGASVWGPGAVSFLELSGVSPGLSLSPRASSPHLPPTCGHLACPPGPPPPPRLRPHRLLSSGTPPGPRRACQLSVLTRFSSARCPDLGGALIWAGQRDRTREGSEPTPFTEAATTQGAPFQGGAGCRLREPGAGPQRGLTCGAWVWLLAWDRRPACTEPGASA